MTNELPAGFIYVSDVVLDIIEDIKYYSSDNFLGVRVEGYESPRAVSTISAAKALQKATSQLKKDGYSLKIFDAYRPKRAVDHFLRWVNDLEDTKTKAIFYPDIKKDQLIKNGYIGPNSRHSSGSAFDVTLVNRMTGQELDMGTVFDFFGQKSHHGTHLITSEQTQNRHILKRAMVENGFQAIKEEWWHYQLEDEPYPLTAFNFIVK
ncbi:vancomycin B-type resistance protein VanX [Bacillus sp. JCM 19046]|uniref:D-alanyl-D-alanine dipeptidase n=1 Tax=Shouchella xiaoxiensis TaxID=766895 RepID=A0ABS2SQE7_9BACI|nr:M15 family metallopeptidase [Shouchella xiaoxiensis]MBM7837236.1 D-alanyl-D-alanine dipeptidase [Shouchella xiaoxiensis]GAF11423.1 vancomycin B-type resistance protein VanX [Bacillus sp. JCM 19045]GAF18376.1 vancomycin B-type resistance protein VanX [Bacillus sp. JCM 19046]